MFFSTHEASATPTTVPSAPQNLHATAGTGKVILTWQAPSSNGGSAITGYKIYRSTSSGTETGYVSLGNVTSYTNTGLTNGITYFYKVRAVNSVGISPLSNEASATPSFTITLRATKTSVTPNPATTAIGKPITFNAKVLDSGSGTQSVPSGTVSWSDGGVGGGFNSTSCTLAPLNGSANSSICNISYMPPANAGKVTLTGSYSGDSTHSTSSGTSDLTVTLRTTKTTILPNPATTAIGAPITFQTKVLDSSSGTKIIPTGTVSWSDGGSGGSFNATSCTLSQYSTSTSTCYIVYTPSTNPALVTINGTYSGDSTHKKSFGTSALNVTSHPPTTTIITTNTFRSTPLVINQGDLLQINSGATLTMASSLDNNGTINILSGGTLKLEPGHATTNHVGGVININGTLMSPGGYGFCCTGWSTITMMERSIIETQSLFKVHRLLQTTKELNSTIIIIYTYRVEPHFLMQAN